MQPFGRSEAGTPMLKPEHRNSIQQLALEQQAIWQRGERRRSDWPGMGGVIGLTGLGAFGAGFVGGLEVALGLLGLATALTVGSLLYFRSVRRQQQQDLLRSREIVEHFHRYGMSISYDGKTVSDGVSNYDPISFDAFGKDEA
jgi:hypothetical protein